MCFEIQDSSDFIRVKQCEYRILRFSGSETYEYLYCAIKEDYKGYYSLIIYCSHKLLNEVLLPTGYCLTQSHKIQKRQKNSAKSGGAFDWHGR